MQRRTLIKQLAFASGAFLLVPSCAGDKNKASILLKKISINGDQERLLAELCETIIPKTNTPGAKDLGAHLFTLMMVDDCLKEKDQQKYLAGFINFEKATRKQFNKGFLELIEAERTLLLTDLEAKKSNDADLQYFYDATKKLTIQAYTTSKYYLTNVQLYQLVPGKYRGCVPANSTS